MNIDRKKVHVILREVTFDLKSWESVKEELKHDYGEVTLAEAYQIFADFCKNYPDAELNSELGAFEFVEGNVRTSKDQIETRLRLFAKMPFTVGY